MDLPLVIAILSVLIATFASLLSTSLSYLTQEEIDELNESEHRNAKLLHKQWLRYDDKFNIFSILKVVFYSVALITYGLSIAENNTSISNGIQGYALLILFILALKFITFIIGIRYSKSTSINFTKMLEILFSITAPIEILYSKLTENASGMNKEEVSREEISALVESARDEGSIDDDEYRILKNIMKFSEVYVSDVMTPRTVINSFNSETTVEEALNSNLIYDFSRIPIWEGNSIDDSVCGYVLTKDILMAAIDKKLNYKLKQLKREINLINENVTLDRALEEFLRRRKHLFIVVDEYGGVEGLLTMEDVLETMLGVEIVDEADKYADLRLMAKTQRDRRIQKRLGDK